MRYNKIILLNLILIVCKTLTKTFIYFQFIISYKDMHSLHRNKAVYYYYIFYRIYFTNLTQDANEMPIFDLILFETVMYFYEYYFRRSFYLNISMHLNCGLRESVHKRERISSRSSIDWLSYIIKYFFFSFFLHEVNLNSKRLTKSEAVRVIRSLARLTVRYINSGWLATTSKSKTACPIDCAGL